MKKSLKKNAILVMIKTTLSLMMPIITFPYISRVLQVNAIGKYNFSLSIISYFTLIAELGISTYAIREGAKIRENIEKFNQFANEIVTISILSTLLSYILLIITVMSFTKFDGYYILIFLLSFQILLNTFSRSWIYNVYEEFGLITIIQIISQLLIVILLIIFVKKPEDVNIYAIIHVLSTGLPNIFYGIYSKKYIKYKFRFNLDIIKKHLKPIILIFSTTIASTIYVNSDITILGWLINDHCVGLYSTSTKIYTIVKQVMLALITVAIPRLSLYTDKEGFKSLFNQIFDILISFVFPTTIGLFIMSENIILIIAGEEFIGSIISLQILSFALIFALLGCLFGTGVLIPYKHESTFLYATIISALINIVLNFCLIPNYKQNATAFSTLIAEFIVFLICYYYSKKYIDDIKLTKYIPVFLGCVSIVIYCFLIKLIHFNLIMETIICILGSILLYAVIEIVLKNVVFIEVCNWFVNILKKKLKK